MEHTFESIHKIISTRIISKKSLPESLDFDVNSVKEYKEYRDHDSNNHDNLFTYRVKGTLLHTAIHYKDVEAIRFLLSQGADINIPKVILEEERKQRDLIRGTANTMDAEYNDWRKLYTDTEEKTITTIDAAQETYNYEIIKLIQTAADNNQLKDQAPKLRP